MSQISAIDSSRLANGANIDSPLLFRFEARLELVPIGMTPEGLRMANSYTGHVTDGLLEEFTVLGTDHLLLRRDGVCIIDAQTLLRGPNDINVYEHVLGYCLPPSSMDLPPLETLLEPGFAWPDIDFPVLATSTFRTGSAALEFLNRTVGRIDGWANFNTGGLAVNTTSIQHDDRVPAANEEP